jgi:nucleoid DNA-binding protein
MKVSILIMMLSLFSTVAIAQSDRGISREIAKELSMDEEQVFQVLKAFKKQVVIALKDEDIVRLQGLGQFYSEHQPARAGNPQTGENEAMPAKKWLRFKASKVGNQSLN